MTEVDVNRNPLENRFIPMDPTEGSLYTGKMIAEGGMAEIYDVIKNGGDSNMILKLGREELNSKELELLFGISPNNSLGESKVYEGYEKSPIKFLRRLKSILPMKKDMQSKLPFNYFDDTIIPQDEFYNIRANNNFEESILTPPMGIDPIAIRSLREAAILHIVNERKGGHPNIIKLIGGIRILRTGLDEYRIGFLLEKIGNGDNTLSEYFKKIQNEGNPAKKKIVIDNALNNLVTIADALDFINLLPVNIRHRDLKPENILIENISTDKERWILGDFGLGLFGSDTKGLILGSLNYQAPEIILDSKNGGIESELYSFAKIYAAMLAGKKSIRNYGHNLEESTDIVIHQPPFVDDLTQRLIKRSQLKPLIAEKAAILLNIAANNDRSQRMISIKLFAKLMRNLMLNPDSEESSTAASIIDHMAEVRNNNFQHQEKILDLLNTTNEYDEFMDFPGLDSQGEKINILKLIQARPSPH